MKTLNHRISELLFEYDCIIIPEFGGFITNYKPAYIDEHLDLLFPPSKAIGFNSNLTQNDGLLANYIAQEDQISFENACARIKSEVETYFEKLNEGKRVDFDKVGILYMDAENKIHFDPDESINYLTSSFGLHKFYYPKFSKSIPSRQTEVKEAVKETSDVPVIPIDAHLKREEKATAAPVLLKNSSKNRYWVAAVMIPLILYFGLVTWQSDIVNDGTVHQSDFNPFKQLQPTKYEARNSKEFQMNNVEIPPFIAPEIPEDIPPIKDSEAGEIKHEVKISNDQNLYATEEIAQLKYHVINGCFSVQKNAERQTKRLRKKGFPAHILDKKGKLYRVSQGSFQLKQEAIELLRAARIEENKDSWLLVK